MNRADRAKCSILQHVGRFPMRQAAKEAIDKFVRFNTTFGLFKIQLSKSTNILFQNKDIAPKKHRRPSKRIEQSSSTLSAQTDQDIDTDASDDVSETLPSQQPEFDLEAESTVPAEIPADADGDDSGDASDDSDDASIADLSSTPSHLDPSDPPIKNGRGNSHRNKEHQSPEREIFYFYGASGRIITSGHSIRLSMKGRRKH